MKKRHWKKKLDVVRRSKIQKLVYLPACNHCLGALSGETIVHTCNQLQLINSMNSVINLFFRRFQVAAAASAVSIPAQSSTSTPSLATASAGNTAGNVSVVLTPALSIDDLDYLTKNSRLDHDDNLGEK